MLKFLNEINIDETAKNIVIIIKIGIFEAMLILGFPRITANINMTNHIKIIGDCRNISKTLLMKIFIQKNKKCI
jgi:hypothetical protein